MQIEIFYNELNCQTMRVANAATRGTLMSKTANVHCFLLNEIATNIYQWPTERSSAKKVARFYEINLITTFAAQMSSLIKQIDVLTSHMTKQKATSTSVISTFMLGD